MADKHGRSGTLAMKVTCAVAFVLYMFCLLYFYQADMLAAAQHVLSGGLTHYDRLIGALLITSALFLIQVGVYLLTRLERLAHAATYIPSLLLLAFIMNISPDMDGSAGFVTWFWLVPLLLVVFTLFAWLYRKIQPYEPEYASSGLFSRLTWSNLFVMTMMFLGVGLVAKGDDVFHYRMEMERYLLEHDYQSAQKVGQKSLQTDSALMMLRVYALAKAGKLGDKLFTYPLAGGSQALLPNTRSVKLMMFPEQLIYKDLGLYTKRFSTPIGYLEFIKRKHLATQMGLDYLLTGYLLDRDLPAFVRLVMETCRSKAALPRHYREALTLYTHMHVRPLTVYHESAMEADFQGFQQLYHAKGNRATRITALRDKYGDTYWYYYLSNTN